ncbi:hypothetical protein CHARACLAT_004314 [Characodon lateralis]|uniref:Uncharacterized protein n=1 Tax=Characodon lateralis TaxID=208331 RepID=A0ABU7DYM8_9TELE|nr:hypothetical protein [Characodon lateralis]
MRPTLNWANMLKADWWRTLTLPEHNIVVATSCRGDAFLWQGRQSWSSLRFTEEDFSLALCFQVRNCC